MLSYLTSLLRWAGLVAVLALTACARTPVRGDGTPVVVPTFTPRVVAERQALVQDIVGVLETRPDATAAWMPAGNGLIVQVGYQLRTGPQSRVQIQFTEGTRLTLDANTLVTLNLFRPALAEPFTGLGLEQGRVWLALSGGPASAADVQTAAGLAQARNAFMSVAFDPATRTFSVTCLQGKCNVAETFIPEGHKLVNRDGQQQAPAPMALGDFGIWGVNVPEATELAPYATEAVAQSNVTLPAPDTPTPTAPPPITDTPAPTTALDQPTATPPPPPLPTLPGPPPPTPTPIIAIGSHRVLGGETLFCIGRVYGVDWRAIASANGVPYPYTVRAGQNLIIPADRWANILPGPVCAPQFTSPFPGLPYETPTPPVPPTPAEPPTPAPALNFIEVAVLCVGGCEANAPSYRIRIISRAEGGAPPLVFSPAVEFDVDAPRCTERSGSVTVTSADGQQATRTWWYGDEFCPPTATPQP